MIRWKQRYDSLGDEPLKEHIDEFAQVIYPAG